MTNGKILEYEIKLQQFLSRMEGKDDFEYFDPDTVIPVRVNKTKNTFFKIENLEPGTSYVVTVSVSLCIFFINAGILSSL